MSQLAAQLPVKRADVVSWPTGKPDEYLVRNRSTGEVFRLGAEEHFLLTRLDGRLSADEIRAAFASNFGQPLVGGEWEDFLKLASEQGVLDWKDCGANAAGRAGREPATPIQASAPQSKTRNWTLRTATRLLAACAAALQSVAARLNRLAAMIHSFRLKNLDFVPRKDDVFIVTYPRSGTTWMQMILYQLTSDGSMEIPHIGEYCPWFERSLRSGRGFETRPGPRLFKSHLSYRQIPKGPGKYIYVARDGKDVAISNYHLERMYIGYEGTFADYFDRFLRGQVECGSWFAHVSQWWQHRDDPGVLFLTYEELTRDLESCVRRIADFCGFDLPPERLPGILERCRFAFMKEHERKFDPAMEVLWEQGVQLNGFIRRGRVGESAVELSSDQRARF